MGIELYCWNVLHGDANIFTVLPSKSSYIIDFGSMGSINDDVVRYAVDDAHRILEESKHIDIFVTHIHADHCNLLPAVTKGLKVHLVYYPAIPQPEEPIATCICEAIAFCMIKVPRFRVIRDTLEKGVAKPLSRGDIVKLDNNLYARILWPPSNLSNHKKGIVRRLEQKVRKLCKMVEKKSKEERIEKDVKDLAERIMDSLISQKDKDSEERLIKDKEEKPLSPQVIWNDLRQINSSEKMDNEVKEILEYLKGIEDDISLVLKLYYGFPDNENSQALALIPGDVSGNILNYLSDLERKEPAHHKHLAFLRASHHGTRYGRYIGEHRSAVTWISWTRSFYSKYRCRSRLRSKYMLNSIIPVIAEDTRSLRMYIDLPRLRFPRILRIFCSIFCSRVGCGIGRVIVDIF